ncbi:hypothetical protein [Hymenobacter guriensis]|uniref:Lipoprotein n=1 Tax=Hymenobacter guriensis TaxID=2793065 RepID=A0ABS0KWZ7_9BACT|nr:hypothetical protein [Hymenobacter guriensis]MBG8552382.1 hypothetical protein [Hymenobacter guriensis]
MRLLLLVTLLMGGCIPLRGALTSKASPSVKVSLPLLIEGDTLNIGKLRTGDTLLCHYPMGYSNAESINYCIQLVWARDTLHTTQFVYQEEAFPGQRVKEAKAFFHAERGRWQVLATSHHSIQRQPALLDSVVKRVYSTRAVGIVTPSDFYYLQWPGGFSLINDVSNGLALHRALQQILGLPLQPKYLTSKPKHP